MRLVDVQRHTGDSMEFLDSAKSDLFPDEIFVFTPKGKIIDLRLNATALDFAYAIHTDIGNHTLAALVDKVEVPLSTRLYNGQTVKILTDPAVHPKPEWLEFVSTARARTSIRAYLKSMEHQDTVALGLRLLEQALNARGSSLDAVPQERWDQFLRENHLARQEDLFRDLALGTTLSNIVAAKLAPDSRLLAGMEGAEEALTLAGSEGSAVSFAACCLPVPGDRIMAYVSTDKGLVVHRTTCTNVRELRKHPDRCVDVIWAPITQGMFRVALRIVANNVPGALANISGSIAETGSNIERVSINESNPETSNMLFNISVENREHLARVLKRLRRNSQVLRVNRI
jgi:guanosine-3',5'-bis(diphosphate) 3'-pyrophosphohydrolase